jgi:superfamily II DNA or RNA helicase
MTTSLQLPSRNENSLRLLALNSEYRSAGIGLGKDFLANVLPVSTEYSRAVGFFSSSVFEVASTAWEKFFNDGGVVRLVCSECFSASDVSAMYQGVVQRPYWRRRNLSDAMSSRARDGNGPFLSWLIANDRLKVKIAFPKPQRGHSIYHEKIGVFEDAKHNQVAVSGSANESSNAWQGNYERIDVFVSWSENDARERCHNIAQSFEKLWTDETAGASIFDLVDCILEGKLRILENADLASISHRAPTSESRPEQKDAHPNPAEVFAPPSDLTLFEHQQRAVAAWVATNGRGVLEMATGSGKTITALNSASLAYDRFGPGLAIVIVAPYLHLIDQWVSVSRRYGLRPIRCADAFAGWQAQLGAAIDSLNVRHRGVLSIVVTAATLARPHFQSQLNRIRQPMLIIGDEVHNYGTAAAAAALPTRARFRIGLSATPTRWMDEDGTRRIETYFGSVAYRYGLGDGIRDQILTPYRYFPQFVSLTNEEFDEYVRLSNLIRRYAGAHDPDEGDVSSAVESILIKRARLVASAAGKVSILGRLLEPRRKDRHILVYCGDGFVEGDNDEGLIRQVESTTQMIGSELGMSCASYTYRSSAERKKEILRDFEKGNIQVLVAIRCLDEGMDIPSTRTAFILASSTNPRQFVQRRGRVLRRHPSKSRAEIYDFFVTPPADDMNSASQHYEFARALVRAQVHRAAEFASLAENGPVARGTVTAILAPLHLLDIWS